MKTRSHNEWFMALAKTKCECGRKHARGDIVAWGEYHAGRWNTIKHFCKDCAESRVIDRLIDHLKECGCEINLCARSGCDYPSWLDDMWEAALVESGLVCGA